MPCERPSVVVPPAAPLGNCYPPTALDLLLGDAVYAGTSRTVYNLIRSVEQNGCNFTPIPEDVVLTVTDLKSLESRGFVISRGYIGINTTLSTAFYGTA